MHAVPVPLPGLDAGDEGVPHEAVDLGEVDALLGSVVLDEAQLDALGDLGEEREVDPGAVVRRTEGVGLAGPDLHWGLPSGGRESDLVVAAWPQAAPRSDCARRSR